MFKGIYTPIVTPFNELEEIDYSKMAHNLDRWGKTGLDGIVVLGTNGEFVYLGMEEKIELIKFVVKNFNPDKVIADTGCRSTRDTIAVPGSSGGQGSTRCWYCLPIITRVP